MKRTKMALLCILVVAMLFSLLGCGEKGPDVTGKYICVGESYGDADYHAPTSEAWVELKKGGKGVYNAGFEFDLKWKLDGESFTGTVTFLGMEETMVGTLKDNVLEVEYGEGYRLRMVKEGTEAPAEPSSPDTEPTAEPAESSKPEEEPATEPAQSNDPAGETKEATSYKKDINKSVVVAPTLVEAFPSATIEVPDPIDPSTIQDTPSGILIPETVENPSEWYGFVSCTDYWGIEQDDIFLDARAVIGTEAKPFIEVFTADDEQTPFFSAYMTLEENGRTVRPDIGTEDAWVGDRYLTPEEADTYSFMLQEGGLLGAVVDYISPDGSNGYFLTMFFRPQGSLWMEEADRLPPGYDAYKEQVLAENPSLLDPNTEVPEPSDGYFGKSNVYATGLVDKIEWLQAAKDAITNKTGTIYYEDILDACGVDGMFDATRSDEKRNYYLWSLADNSDVRLLVGFLKQEDGSEKYSSYSSNGLD